MLTEAERGLDGGRAAVPEILAPPPRHPRFPLLDGMRAVAVLCVVVVHAAGAALAISPSLPGRLLAHLNIGVTIFFLISGFLLYRPFIAHRTSTAPPPGVGAYAKRRLLRIFPAYWLVLTVLLTLRGRSAIGGAHLLSMYSLTNVLPIFGGPGCTLANCDFGQVWSLSAELSFYLCLPLYVLVVERATRGLRLGRWVTAELALLAILSAASIVLQFAVFYPAPNWVGWTVSGTVFWFALGMALAVVSVAGAGSRRTQRLTDWVGGHAPLLWGTAIAVYVALSLGVAPSSFLLPAGQALEIHLAFGVVALLLLAPVIFAGRARSLPQRMVGTPVIAWLGLVSYGIFLWHAPVMLAIGGHWGRLSTLVLLAASLAVSIPCAVVSYYVLERPVMKLKYRPLIARRTDRA